MLEGRATLRQNGEFRELKPGDIVFFKTGPEFAHQFYNHTDVDFVFVAISNNSEVEVCEYPDSKKVLTSVPKKGGGRAYAVVDKRMVDYWRGEKDPSKHWTAPRLKRC